MRDSRPVTTYPGRAMPALLTRLGLAAAAVGLLVAAVPAPALAEQIPGPPARPGQEPIGGPLLKGTGLVMQAEGAVPDPPVKASAWLLADASTGEVLAAKAPHVRYRPASTLKTLTAITLMPQLDLTKIYRAKDEDANAEGSRVGLVPGAGYSVNDLWHALLLPSANDAASALANANGGWKRTLTQMNAEAKHLQAYDTVAKTPSGLDENGQFTSAYDLALIARQALRTPGFVEVSGTMSYVFPGKPATPGKKRSTYPIYGQNRLLNHGFEGTVAGKTGYTTEAGRTFWVAVKRGDRTLIGTFLRIQDGTEETAKALMTWGFKNAGKLAPVGTLVAADPATPGAAATGQGVDAQGASMVNTAGPSAAPGGGLPGWFWVLLPVVLVVGALVALRRRAVVRERERAAARASARRARSWQ